MRNRQEMINVYKKYSYDIPIKARYKRGKNRIYFYGDFHDGEEIEFFRNCEKPNACAKGNVWYRSKDKGSKLVNIKELEAIN